MPATRPQPRTARARPRTRRAPRALLWAGGLLLASGLAGARWATQPAPVADAPAPAAPVALDVVSIGFADVENGVTGLSPAVPGRIVRIDVKAGQDVTAGQEIMRVDDRLQAGHLLEAQTALASAEQQRATAGRGPALHALKVQQQTASIAAVESRSRAATEALALKRESRMLNLIPQAEVTAAEALVREIEQLQRVENSRMEELKLNDPQQAIRQADLAVELATVRVKLAKQAVEDCIVRAPKDGKILRRLANVGDLSAPTTPQPPLLFCPNDRLIVRCEVEQEFLSRVKPGLRASISDDSGADSHTWTGRVEQLADWIARRRSVVFEPGLMTDVRTLECIVSVEPDAVPLRVGQRVRVRIHAGE